MRSLSRNTHPVPAFVAGALDQLDQRLLRDAPAPVAVAVSGGGDSTALLMIAARWAQAASRRLVVLSVDHGLTPAAASWTRSCAGLAGKTGADFGALAWTGPKPATGLPAAARAARHVLLADAAREAGARVILMGHTASDLAEAAAMRLAGSTAPDPQAWGPSPAWPEGRGVFLLRPLLHAGRAEIRQWLAAEGAAWIDDPANDDLRFARARARASAPAGVVVGATPGALLGAEQVTEGFGVLTLPKPLVRGRLLRLAAVCAGGGGRIPSGKGDCQEAVSTLAGARIVRRAQTVTVCREPGEVQRGGLRPLTLKAGEPVVWDGRFEITAHREGLAVRSLAGVRARLSAADRKALAAIPAAARGGLPALTHGEAVSSPLTTDCADASIRSLVGERFAAAAGLVTREPA